MGRNRHQKLTNVPKNGRKVRRLDGVDESPVDPESAPRDQTDLDSSGPTTILPDLGHTTPSNEQEADRIGSGTRIEQFQEVSAKSAQNSPSSIAFKEESDKMIKGDTKETLTGGEKGNNVVDTSETGKDAQNTQEKRSNADLIRSDVDKLALSSVDLKETLSAELRQDKPDLEKYNEDLNEHTKTDQKELEKSSTGAAGEAKSLLNEPIMDTGLDHPRSTLRNDQKSQKSQNNPRESAPPPNPLPQASQTSQTSTKSSTSKLPKGWSLRKLALELPLAETEQISTIASFDANLYIGSSHGQLFHLYLFDDAEDYLLILQISISESGHDTITKILPVAEAEMCLVVAGKVLYSYSLPELSPCRVGKVKDVEDVLLLRAGKLPSDKTRPDKVIVYTPTKLRVLHVQKTGIKLLRDINYTGAQKGVSCAAGTSANYSNICITANDTRYDVVDMQQARKIPLFDYNPGGVAGVVPLIVPYYAEDLVKPEEEYMLPICTEEAMSMAMFVNSTGDVTRGTVTWINEGYPHHGLVIDWPYVVGIFSKGRFSGNSTSSRLVVSSLKSLDTVCTVDCRDILVNETSLCSFSSLQIITPGKDMKVADDELLHLLLPVYCMSRDPVAHEKQFTWTKTIVTDGRQLFYFHKTSKITENINTVLDVVQNVENGDDLAQCLQPQLEVFRPQLVPVNDFDQKVHLVLLLLSGGFGDLKLVLSNTSNLVDPRLLMLYCTSSEQLCGDFWATFSAESVFFQLRDSLPETAVDKNHGFLVWLIQKVYAEKDLYDDVIGGHVRRLIYTETCHGPSDLISAVDAEKELWLGQNAISDELLEYFRAKKHSIVLLHILLLKQETGNTFDDWLVQIVDICLELLAKNNPAAAPDTTSPQNDVLALAGHSFDLVEIAFLQLKDHVLHEGYYTKKLLALLQLRPEPGLKLLKAAKGGKFASTHKFILTELSKSYEFDSKLNLLKIEYTEQSFLESSKNTGTVDLTIAAELLQHYLEYLQQDDLEVGYENLNILYTTYTLENDLKDPQWPKITWIEYLHLHYRKSECQEFLAVYLKVYEVMVLHVLLQQQPKHLIPVKNDAVSFLIWIGNDAENRELRLRDIHDYSTWEWLLFHEYPPIPRSSFLIKTLVESECITFPGVAKEKSAANFQSLLGFYLSLEEETAKNASVTHVVNDYANEYLSLEDILKELPPTFPLVFVERFIAQQLLTLENQRANSLLTKALNKANAKLDAAVLKDFEKTAEILASTTNNDMTGFKTSRLP